MENNSLTIEQYCASRKGLCKGCSMQKICTGWSEIAPETVGIDGWDKED